jgi:hypothetical protein
MGHTIKVCSDRFEFYEVLSLNFHSAARLLSRTAVVLVVILVVAAGVPTLVPRPLLVEVKLPGTVVTPALAVAGRWLVDGWSTTLTVMYSGEWKDSGIWHAS